MRAILGAVLLFGGIGGSAMAQVVVGPGEEAEVAACLCLQQAVAVLGGETKTKNDALDAARHELAELDRQLAEERPHVDVNNPQSVGRYKALLERRDAAHRRSLGPVVADARDSAARYNARVDEYNTRCANRPHPQPVVNRVQATLTCPPLR
jgi:hypothetical protein